MLFSDWSSDVCSPALVQPEVAQRRVREDADRGGVRGKRGTGELPNVWTAVPRQARLPRRAVPGGQHLAAVRRRCGLSRRRTEERRAGQECASTCISRWSQIHIKKNWKK